MIVEAKPDAKLAHSIIDYQPWNGMPGNTCANCVNMIEAQQVRCKSVADPIVRGGWCMKWEPK